MDTYQVGIDVSKQKEVAYNGNHQDLLDTSIERNPKRKTINKIIVFSIFKRKKHADSNVDGSPFMHSLKGNNGYSITITELLNFRKNFYSILDKALDGKHFDLVIPLSSSSQVNEYFARRIARRCGAQLIVNAFEKKLIKEVIVDLEGLLDLQDNLAKERTKLLNYLNKAQEGKQFAIKEVRNHRLRKKINPFKANIGLNIQGKRILIVDDLIASGASLHGAYMALGASTSEASIEAISLCGSL
jgi:pyrimidine operon attenuation protein/uracil phosphoribosyltransferase